ncbi:uracil-DNA glycosylase family protein [Sporosarcina gallistercoris]|uniref:uracil-DNA glycosylase family protein n=1 Tax=Sporosarcina gallistercoris TaxID=2762245 RepID=UPI003D2CC32B
MEKIIDLHLSFLDRLAEKGDVLRELEREGISVLPGFKEQAELVRAYYKKFYSKLERRIVFCGINPGQYGAGKTGVPFIDFDGIDRLLPGYGRQDKERSAQFMLSIIEEYDLGEFQDAVYLTNVSWFGFLRNGKNLNYYTLPRTVRHHFIESFVEEMKIVNPSFIIPLSEEVGRTLRQLVKEGQLDYPIADRLPHPLHGSFPTNLKKTRMRYLKCIEQLAGVRRKGEDSSES